MNAYPKPLGGPVYLRVVAAAEASAGEAPDGGGGAVDEAPDGVGRPAWQEAAEDPGREREQYHRDEGPDEQHRPVAPPVEAGQPPGHVPAEKEREEDQDAEDDEPGDDGSPKGTGKVWREAQGREHDAGDGGEDRARH